MEGGWIVANIEKVRATTRERDTLTIIKLKMRKPTTTNSPFLGGGGGHIIGKRGYTVLRSVERIKMTSESVLVKTNGCSLKQGCALNREGCDHYKGGKK